MSLAHLHTPRMSDTKPYFSERLTAEEEKQMAREIRKAEQEAREAVAGIDEADSILTVSYTHLTLPTICSV